MLAMTLCLSALQRPLPFISRKIDLSPVYVPRPDAQTSNRAAARRIADHLALIGFTIKRQEPGDDGTWKETLNKSLASDKHLDRLALAEHLAWAQERIANGWSYGKVRDNSKKKHPLLVSWAKLPPTEQDKDRIAVLAMVDVLDKAEYKAVPMSHKIPAAE